tara:strand:- start:101 stop:640 length:540 start_codon:yes stop_codon:yes gene_type:complete
MKRISFIKFTVIFIAAFCSANSIIASAEDAQKILTKQEIENKFNLPPEPDEKLNNATILGIDSNNNSIRDDLERKIAFAYPTNEYARKLFTRQAKIWTDMVNNQDDIPKLKSLVRETWIMLECTDEFDNTPEMETFYDEIYRNIYERAKLYNELKRKAKYYNKIMDQSVIDTYCSKFKK